MTTDEFLVMARAAGFYHYDMPDVEGQDLGQSLEADGRDALDRLVQALTAWSQAEVATERDACAKINEAKAKQMNAEGWTAEEEGDEAARSGCHASAWLLNGCAIDMRKRGY